MTRRRVSNPLALAVLSCLNEKPMHPYEISTTLRTRGKETSIKLNYGSLYSVVDSLERNPRKLTIVYRNPVEHETIIATGRFELRQGWRWTDGRGTQRGASVSLYESI